MANRIEYDLTSSQSIWLDMWWLPNKWLYSSLLKPDPFQLRLTKISARVQRKLRPMIRKTLSPYGAANFIVNSLPKALVARCYVVLHDQAEMGVGY
jgi:hypothetical protein